MATHINASLPNYATGIDLPLQRCRCGFVLPPAEAMACGCAGAVTDCGGKRDLAEHKKNALVSDPDDSVSLVNDVLRLPSDEELRIKIALGGRDRIESSHGKQAHDD